MHSIKILTIATLASLLGASAVHAGSNASPDWNVGDVRALTQHGNQFQQNLHREYVALAQSEQTEESDSHSMVYYNHKARQSAAGYAVAPTMMTERDVPAAYVTDLTDGRAALMRMLDAGGPSKAPVLSAHAQSQFDCWIEEQTENRQPKKIALCRDEFNSALVQASSVVFDKTHEPAPAPAPMAAAPSPRLPANYIVFFDWNKAAVTPEAAEIIRTAAANAGTMGQVRMVLTGHTDSSGSAKYNLMLSQRRGDDVRAQFEALGFANADIQVISKGEADQLVPTDDGVREPQNRRVEIVLP
jgi:outer membrane protein OmpA-like peptidoglycan-associated protein